MVPEIPTPQKGPGTRDILTPTPFGQTDTCENITLRELCLWSAISLTVFSEGDLPGPGMRFGLVSSHYANIRVRVHKVRWVERNSAQAY